MKDTMTESSPSAETIRFVIEILSARTTPLTELPQTIANIAHAVARLGAASDNSHLRLKSAPAATAPAGHILGVRKPVRAQPVQRLAVARPAPVEPAVSSAAARPVVVPVVIPARRRGRPRLGQGAPGLSTAEVSAARSVSAEPVFGAAGPVVVPVVIPARRRGRPRRTPLVQDAPVVPVPEVAPPQPRLLRRSDAQAFDVEHHGESQPVFRAPDGPLRGVVKWFDGRAGKGALRLAGVSGDVLLDPTVLTNSGIKRLYKDQEIEATVEETGGRIRLLSLSLPTRNGEPTLNIMAGEITGTVRRQPRSVQVEIKRDGIRQSAARAEAEQVLGGVGRVKPNRRLTP
jgi:cold shock CspA family protein